MSATGNFFRYKQILFQAWVIAFQISKIYNYILYSNFNRNFPKLNFEMDLLDQFLK